MNIVPPPPSHYFTPSTPHGSFSIPSIPYNHPHYGSPLMSPAMSPPPTSLMSLANSVLLPHTNNMIHKTAARKRKQVRNACVNCQKACKKCDEGRPCARCNKYNLSETCTNSTRKERQKGVKRGPYKRRQQNSHVTKTGFSSDSVRFLSDSSRTLASHSHRNALYPQINDVSQMRQPYPFSISTGVNQYSQTYENINHCFSYPKEQMMPQCYMSAPIYSNGNPLMALW